MIKSVLLRPFLTLPFKSESYRVLSGWFYSAKDFIVKVSGSANHYAIDFELKISITVLAAASGWALYSYQHSLLRDRKDRRKFIRHNGKLVGNGQGNFIIIYHPKQRLFTQYAHLGKISPEIPFYPPAKKRGKVLPPTKKFQPDFFRKPNARWVERGEVIGWVGDSGIIGGWDAPQLHFEVYRYRDKEGGKPKDSYLDPYDIYRTFESYPWPSHSRPIGKKNLWLRL